MPFSAASSGTIDRNDPRTGALLARFNVKAVFGPTFAQHARELQALEGAFQALAAGRLGQAPTGELGREASQRIDALRQRMLRELSTQQKAAPASALAGLEREVLTRYRQRLVDLYRDLKGLAVDAFQAEARSLQQAHARELEVLAQGGPELSVYRQTNANRGAAYARHATEPDRHATAHVQAQYAEARRMGLIGKGTGRVMFQEGALSARAAAELLAGKGTFQAQERGHVGLVGVVSDPEFQGWVRASLAQEAHRKLGREAPPRALALATLGKEEAARVLEQARQELSLPPSALASRVVQYLQDQLQDLQTTREGHYGRTGNIIQAQRKRLWQTLNAYARGQRDMPGLSFQATVKELQNVEDAAAEAHQRRLRLEATLRRVEAHVAGREVQGLSADELHRVVKEGLKFYPDANLAGEATFLSGEHTGKKVRDVPVEYVLWVAEGAPLRSTKKYLENKQGQPYPEPFVIRRFGQARFGDWIVRQARAYLNSREGDAAVREHYGNEQLDPAYRHGPEARLGTSYEAEATSRRRAGLPVPLLTGEERDVALAPGQAALRQQRLRGLEALAREDKAGQAARRQAEAQALGPDQVRRAVQKARLQERLRYVRDEALRSGLSPTAAEEEVKRARSGQGWRVPAAFQDDMGQGDEYQRTRKVRGKAMEDEHAEMEAAVTRQLFHSLSMQDFMQRLRPPADPQAGYTEAERQEALKLYYQARAAHDPTWSPTEEFRKLSSDPRFQGAWSRLLGLAGLLTELETTSSRERLFEIGREITRLYFPREPLEEDDYLGTQGGPIDLESDDLHDLVKWGMNRLTERMNLPLASGEGQPDAPLEDVYSTAAAKRHVRERQATFTDQEWAELNAPTELPFPEQELASADPLETAYDSDQAFFHEAQAEGPVAQSVTRPLDASRRRNDMRTGETYGAGEEDIGRRLAGPYTKP